jgi:hypothetical protein
MSETPDPILAHAPQQPPAPRLRRFQAGIAILLIVVLIAPFAISASAARSTTFSDWLSRRLMAQSLRDKTLYLNVGPYFDTGDKLLLADLPNADYSHGGVYVFGSSTAMYCLDDYRLPPSEAGLIHNYSVYAMNHRQLFQFIRFLAEHQHWLDAGGEKTFVMLGLSYANSIEPPRLAYYFPSYFNRSGVLGYSNESGISIVPMTPIERFIRTEDARARSVILRCVEGPIITPKRDLDPQLFQQETIGRLGPDWEAVMTRELGQLAELLDYLKARHVNVLGFRVPEGTWNTGIPAHERYAKETSQLFSQRGLTLLETSGVADDEDFYDALHCKPGGTGKIEPILLQHALQFLHDNGSLAAPAN